MDSFPYLRVSATRNDSIPSFFEAIDHQNNKLMLLPFTEIWELSNTLEFPYSIHDFSYACMFWKSVKRFRYAVRTKHWTFRRAITISLYFCFWTTVGGVLKTHSKKFVNAVLVYVYNYLCVYRYFSRYSENKACNIFQQRSLLWLQCSSKFSSFYDDLTLPIATRQFDFRQ